MLSTSGPWLSHVQLQLQSESTKPCSPIAQIPVCRFLHWISYKEKSFLLKKWTFFLKPLLSEESLTLQHHICRKCKKRIGWLNIDPKAFPQNKAEQGNLSLVNAFSDCLLWVMEIYPEINEGLKVYLSKRFILHWVESFRVVKVRMWKLPGGCAFGDWC